MRRVGGLSLEEDAECGADGTERKEVGSLSRNEIVAAASPRLPLRGRKVAAGTGVGVGAGVGPDRSAVLASSEFAACAIASSLIFDSTHA